MVYIVQAPRQSYRRRIPRKYVKAFRSKLREQRKWPSKEYGVAHMKRGDAFTQGLFGEDANPTQAEFIKNRKFTGFRGKGKYTFGGGFNAGADLVAKGKIMGQNYDLKAHGAGNFYGGNGMYNSELHGDSNQLIDKMGSSVAMEVIDSENTLCISNREFIADVAPAANSGNFFTALSSAINPGVATLFPWLSQIALYYEEYEFEQLIFEFKSMVTEGNQNAQGNIIMATQYNALNPLFSSKQQMENYDYANSAKVTQNAFHGVECNPQLNAAAALYVRSGNVPSGQDAKTYDLGIFQFAVSNGYQATSINLGEVWVSYRIKLRKTKLILPGNDLSPVIWNAVYTAAPTSLANLFSGALTRLFNTNSQADVTANTSNTFTLPSFITGGTYAISVVLGNLAAGIGYILADPSVFSNCALSTLAYRAKTTTISGTANINTWMFYIVVTGPSPSVTLPTPGGTFVSGTTLSIYVNQVSSSLI